MRTYDFRLPDIGEGIAEAEVVAWHVKPGDTVAEDEPLVDVMTDKATVEVTSPVAGRVLSTSGEAGRMIAVGSVFVSFELQDEQTTADAGPSVGMEQLTQRSDTTGTNDAEPDEKVSLPAPSLRGEGKELTTSAASRERVLASPSVRKRAKDLGVDLADVHTSNYRVRHSDLDSYLNYNSSRGFSSAAKAGQTEEIKVLGLRRRIAENMSASKRHIPHFTYVEELNVTRLEEVRGELNSGRGDNPRLTILPLLIRAFCKALPDFPMINARYDDEAGIVTRHGEVHLGVATQTDAGLMVPVVRNAHSLNLWQLAAEIARLAQAARSGSARSEELRGSTITVTSLGSLGGVTTTPVINRPEVAILGPNRVIERPVFRGREVVGAKLMNLSISCDHRVVDGWDAASFAQRVKALVEAPALLLAPH